MHTKEPWTVAQPWAGFSEIRGANGELVFGLAAGVDHERQPEEVCEANAARLQAAVNFTAGYSTEALEGITLEEVVARLQFLVQSQNDLSVWIDEIAGHKAVAERVGLEADDTAALLERLTKEGGKP